MSSGEPVQVFSPGNVQRSQIARVIGYWNVQCYMIISNCVPDRVVPVYTSTSSV